MQVEQLGQVVFKHGIFIGLIQFITVFPNHPTLRCQSSRAKKHKELNHLFYTFSVLYNIHVLRVIIMWRYLLSQLTTNSSLCPWSPRWRVNLRLCLNFGNRSPKDAMHVSCMIVFPCFPWCPLPPSFPSAHDARAVMNGLAEAQWHRYFVDLGFKTVFAVLIC